MAPKRSKKRAEEPQGDAVVPDTSGLAIVPEAEVVVEEAGEEPAVEQVILHLPIPASKVGNLLHSEGLQLVPEYNPNLTDPEPYMAYNKFASEATELVVDVPPAQPAPSARPAPKRRQGTKAAAAAAAAAIKEDTPPCNNRPNCFWCCHPIGHQQFGMPIRYDAIHKSFTLFGTFCSLECVSAYNFSAHMGSDRAWEIHAWIQMLARRYNIASPVRPAPSRFLLDIFQGPMGIEEFRSAHRTTDSTYVMNVPPLVSVQAQTECVNTSYISHTQAKPFGRWI